MVGGFDSTSFCYSEPASVASSQSASAELEKISRARNKTLGMTKFAGSIDA
jgi:hypothetical protein